MLIVAILLFGAGLPTVFYMLLSTDWAQERVRDGAERAIEKVLGTQATIDKIMISPFNRLRLSGIKVQDDLGETALSIQQLDARIELMDLLTKGKFIIDYVSIDGLDGRISRASKDAPLNIAGIIEKLSHKDSDQGPKRFDLRLNDVTITDGRLSYVVDDAPLTPGRFNPQRIEIKDLNVAVFAKYISSDTINATLQRLSFDESSGLKVRNISCKFGLSPRAVSLNGLSIDLSATNIEVADICAAINGYSDLGSIGTKLPARIAIKDGSHVYLPDLAPFVPKLAQAKYVLDISADVSGTLDSLHLEQLCVSNRPLGLNVIGSGTAIGLYKSLDAKVNIDVNAIAIYELLGQMDVKVTPSMRKLLGNVGTAHLAAELRGEPEKAYVDAQAKTASGEIAFIGHVAKRNKTVLLDAQASFGNFNIGRLLGNADLGHITGSVDVDGDLTNRKFQGQANAVIDELLLRGYEYHDLNIDIEMSDTLNMAHLKIEDPNARVHADVTDKLNGAWHNVQAAARIYNADLDKLNLWKKFPGHVLSANMRLDAQGFSLKKFMTEASVSRLRYVDSDGEGLKLKQLLVSANSLETLTEINVKSDFLKGNLQGVCDFSTLPRELSGMLKAIMPNLWAMTAEHQDVNDWIPGIEADNEFVYSFTVRDAADVSDFFNIPYKIIDPVEINGGISVKNGEAWLDLDAPWLLNGDKLQEETLVSAKINSQTKNTGVYVTTLMPTKKGPMNMVATISGEGNTLNTNVDWQIIRDIPINGNFNFTTVLDRTSTDDFITTVNFNPGQINFGEDVWNIQPSQIKYADKMLDVNGFALTTDTQAVTVNGRGSQLLSDSLTVDLKNIHLIDIFETLEIDKAMIGGNATGHIYAKGLFSDSLDIYSPDLFVQNIGYNRCVLGDGDIKVNFDKENQAFLFDAVVLEPQGRKSYIRGSLTPATESLDFYFDADHVRVGFMQPFMSAFSSSVDGYASGNAHLYGTFKYIDLEGDIYADSLQIKIDFTNTFYTASDSIHLRPGIIDLQNVTIRDIYDNQAKLNGWVKHTFFKAPVFDFTVSDARNFLSYDVTPKESPDWYGRIFGNGGAYVNGKPGVVNIGVNMTTAPNSTFTFVLSDTEEASEYSFITFRDATPVEIYDSIVDVTVVPKSVQIHQAMMSAEQDELPTAYNMDIQVDINPDAQMTIVMDPIGGDRIRAYGNGHMRMTYGSANNDLRMYGAYTLERGNYNFTLQDIIIKDFTIKEGSSITFTGDPYSAQLNIDAVYSVNANLSDLDESFLQDKELNRTNVPVHALLKVTGNMQQPDIAFDLEFPTLTQDTYRKVRSIVSTEDMMNTQIIYLLALNRFYTPEYMASTTKGNELFSVASSTISSQLSNMLGKLSENWSIAPNLRSDRGDFTDLEVDLMLSSALLNNRLLFNGNFGYRDKSLNTNQFIGDFDIQYLLNRKGSWRLKAYNRFNDQNYYLRTAQTTQGVGLMYRKDFDNIFSFLHKKKKETTDTLNNESNDVE